MSRCWIFEKNIELNLTVSTSSHCGNLFQHQHFVSGSHHPQKEVRKKERMIFLDFTQRTDDTQNEFLTKQSTVISNEHYGTNEDQTSSHSIKILFSSTLFFSVSLTPFVSTLHLFPIQKSLMVGAFLWFHLGPAFFRKKVSLFRFLSDPMHFWLGNRKRPTGRLVCNRPGLCWVVETGWVCSNVTYLLVHNSMCDEMAPCRPTMEPWLAFSTDNCNLETILHRTERKNKANHHDLLCQMERKAGQNKFTVH